MCLSILFAKIIISKDNAYPAMRATGYNWDLASSDLQKTTVNKRIITLHASSAMQDTILTMDSACHRILSVKHILLATLPAPPATPAILSPTVSAKSPEEIPTASSFLRMELA